MKQDLTTNAERIAGLNRPHLVRQTRRRPYFISYFEWRAQLCADWENALDLHRAQLLGVALLLVVGGIAGTAWLLSLLGWIR